MREMMEMKLLCMGGIDITQTENGCQQIALRRNQVTGRSTSIGNMAIDF
jgi:hypothetical protein